MRMSLWHCWSIMFAMSGEMTKGEEWGKEHSDRASGRKNKYVFVQFDLTSNASLLG